MTSKSNSECEAAIIEFAHLTNTDEAFAHSVLQDCNYEVEEAVFKYFTEISPDVPLPDKIIQEVLDAPPIRKRKSSEQPTGLPDEVTIISWNIDGLSKDSIKSRFVAALNVIAKVNPEIIFFQEFVDELDDKMKKVLGSMYNIFKGNEGFPYYTVTLVSKNINIISNKVLNFDSSMMGRTMLLVEAKWQDLELKLLNTHLESMKDHSSTRKNQFRKCMDTVEDLKGPNTLVLFGGDLNIRDNEIDRIANGFSDCWEEGGSKDTEKFTWDMYKNDNLEFNRAARYNMRFRFDRLYQSGPYNNISFRLVGKERMKTLQMFPSDHFAICCKFST